MKNRFLTLGLLSGILLIMASCGQSSETKTQPEKEGEIVSTLADQDNQMYPDTLKGLYSGNFGKSFIVLNLTYVNEHKAVGYNIHKGLQRNVSGSVTERQNDWLLVLDEPGDNPYDGVFTLEISKSDFTVKAVWKARNPKIGTKTFTLKKVPKANNNSKEAEKANEQDRIIFDNFVAIMSYCDSDLGDLEFKENGSVVLHHYPKTAEGQANSQEVTVKGCWRWIDGKVEMEWEDNDILESSHQAVRIEYEKEKGPYFKIGEVEFAPRNY